VCQGSPFWQSSAEAAIERAWAGSGSLTSLLADKVGASRQKEDSGSQDESSRASAGELGGCARRGLRQNTSACNTHIPGVEGGRCCQELLPWNANPGGPKTIADRGKEWERDQEKKQW